MPELPEVETVRRSLLPYLPGRLVARALVRHPKVLIHPLPEAFVQQIQGARFEALERHGKLLIFRMSRGVLLVHLGMTGQLTFRDPNRQDRPFERHPHTGLQRTVQHPVDAHTHISLLFEDECAVHYRDVRKFGKWRFYEPNDPGLQEHLGRLGPDPLTEAWGLSEFVERVRSSQRPIKAILLDQAVVAGVGNIYADEALFLSGIRPMVRGQRLSLRRLQALFEAVPQVLRLGLAHGGTSISDYVDADGRQGQNQEQLRVYGRYGQPCRVCQAPLQRTTVAQRTSSWCKVCQRP